MAEVKKAIETFNSRQNQAEEPVNSKTGNWKLYRGEKKRMN